MLDEEWEYTKRMIACILDSPSVFMCGPSQNSLRRAGLIMDALEHSGRLVPTTCTHDAWDEKTNGIACPTCGMHMTKTELPEFLFKAS